MKFEMRSINFHSLIIYVTIKKEVKNIFAGIRFHLRKKKLNWSRK